MKQMKKKIIAALTALLLAVLFCTPVAAKESEGFESEYLRLMDMANLLDDAEEEKLMNALDEVSERQKLEIVIVTEDTLDGADIVSYADDLYDYCNFGYGADKDGVMFFISMEDRDWYISTSGYGITAFTDAGIQYIGNQMKEELSDENYAAAFQTFAEKSDEFITQAREGKPFDKSSLPKEPLPLIWYPISIAIGIVLAIIIVSVMKSSLKSVRFQAAAKDYVKDGSLNITQSNDLLLYRTVDKQEKPKSDSGSSTHTSSSGRTHGGGGGKF